MATIGLVMSLSASFTLLSFAGWEQTGTTWEYNENGTYITGWNWLDGNKDGVAECYYFNAEGVMLASTTTPDNYIVNENGAWVVDGVVQTKAVETHPAPQQTEPQATEAYVEPQQPPYTPGSTVTDANGVTVEIGVISKDQHLPPEVEEAINKIHFN